MIKEEYIENYFAYCAQMLATATLHSSWGSEYALHFLADNFSKLNESFSEVIDWNNLTVKDCDNLKFGKWTSEDEIEKDIKHLKRGLQDGEITSEEYDEKCVSLRRTTKLRLIPIYLYSIIPEGMELLSINGNTYKFKKGETDNDDRFGMLGYGIIPIDNEKEN